MVKYIVHSSQKTIVALAAIVIYGLVDKISDRVFFITEDIFLQV